jgi:5-methyltetrahydrofolate--homocysteine methyltransferase
MERFSDLLTGKAIIIADGGMGTELIKAGLPDGMPPEHWNIANPQVVQNVHRRYCAAGSDFVVTNTFGATRLRLASFGLGNHFYDINQAAVDLAKREANGRSVVGSIGPIGAGTTLDDWQTHSVCRAAYAEQALVLVEQQVDALLIETMIDLTELKIALEGIKPVVNVPIMATMVFDETGRTIAGQSAGEVVNTLASLGVDVVGANCCSSIQGMIMALCEMRLHNSDIALMAKPNAGLPYYEQDQLIYDFTPDLLAEYTAAFLNIGVRIIGGCCGTTAMHITALKAAIKRQRDFIV